MVSYSPVNTGERYASIRTEWPTVFLAIAAGAFAAFQVGKVHIALPSIRHSFAIGLVSASWILSALNIVGLFTATPAGSLASRIGNKRAVVIGLMCVAIASTAGGFSPNLPLLLASRFIEGIGYVLIVVAAPSLIVQVTSAANLRLALAGWSCYVPGGVALITVLAPLVLAHHTWRAVWWWNGAILFSFATLLSIKAKTGLPVTPPKRGLGTWDQLTCVVASRGPLLLAIIFGMYTMQHLSIMGFMPTLLHERFNVSEGHIGVLVAIAMASNIIGNLAAGVLLQRGASRARIISLASIFMAIMTVGMFVLHLPLAAFYSCAFAFSCVGGLVPSSVMGAAPFHTPSPSLLGATNGLLVQGSNLGIVVGPPLLSYIATHFGWNWVPLMTGVSAVVAAILASNMRVSAHSNPEFFPEHLPS